LFRAVQQIATGILLLAMSPDSLDTFNTSLAGVLFWQILQGLALLFGTAIVGSGDASGFFHGTLVGIGNGLLCTLFPLIPGIAASDLALYGQTLIHAFLGLVGGWLGSLIWRPPFEFVPTVGLSDTQKNNRRRWKPLLAGAIGWPRVLIGAALGIAGSFWAGYLFDAMLEASQGRLASGSYFQDQIFIWEIKVLVLLLAGATAGANTNNGFKQGLVVGTLAAVVVISLPGMTQGVQQTGIVLLVTLALCTLGGWFGGQLLPPIVVRKKSKYTGPMA
jgi:hypothetical protein